MDPKQVAKVIRKPAARLLSPSRPVAGRWDKGTALKSTPAETQGGTITYDNDNPKSTQQVKKCVAKEARDHLNSIHSGMWEIERSIWNGRDERWAADNKALEEKKRLQQSEAKNKVSGADGGGES